MKTASVLTPPQLLNRVSVESFCPLCNSAAVKTFLYREHVPLLNQLSLSQNKALQIARGTIDLAVCHTCGFIFNCAYQINDSMQFHPTLFDVHQDRTFPSLKLKDYCILKTDNQDYDFNRNYAGSISLLNPFFELKYYNETCTMEDTVLICRQIIERIPDPLTYLRNLRKSLQGTNARIVIETPAIEWILQNNSFWDISYEQCSYFSKNTLTLVCEQAGFHIEQIKDVSGGQYLWCVAICSSEKAITKNPGRIPELAYKFQVHGYRLFKEWQYAIKKLAKYANIALIGSESSAITFANLIDPHGTILSCVGDSQKQGYYIPGTGHSVVSCEDLGDHEVTIAILINPNDLKKTEMFFETNQIDINLIELYQPSCSQKIRAG
jgi:hypothetical protein